MKMVIADRRQTNGVSELFIRTTSRFLTAGLLIYLAFFLTVVGQSQGENKEFVQAQSEFDKGHYPKAIEFAKNGLEKARETKNSELIIELLDVIASSQIFLESYDNADATLNEALLEISRNENNSYQRAVIFGRFAWLLRSQRKFAESINYSTKALSIAPDNQEIRAEYYLNIGRILFSSGYDVSAIIWLEKAEKLLEEQKVSLAQLDVYRILSLAWSNKMNYPQALKYAEKRVSSAENSRFKHKYRQALFDWALVLSSTGQKQKEFAVLEKGLTLSLAANHSAQSSNYLSFLLLYSLYENDITKAEKYLRQLEKIDSPQQLFKFEILLGKAVISGFKGQREISNKLFAELDTMKSSGFILPYWKIAVAEKNGDWKGVIKLSEGLLEITLKNNFREDLPDIYLNFAKAYFHLNQADKLLENLEKTISFIEEIRTTENNNLSLSLFETYHSAYRLLTQIKFDKPQESFETAEFLKARLLKDKINDSAVKSRLEFSPAIRRKLEELSTKFITDSSAATEIEKTESLITVQIPKLDLDKPKLDELEIIPDLDNKAIISYFFTLDKKLLAYVWEKGQPLKTVHLSVTENEIKTSAVNTLQKIKNQIYFKRDGKNLYDMLLKPLNIQAEHLIVVPDKSLWKIPFQALSSDGEKYLIEEKLISYSPSVSLLLQQLKNPKPNRRTLQAFANTSYDNRILRYVNAEATSVSEIYNSKPLINATIADFEQVSDQADILHFSMHAQVDNEQPLESFLEFRKIGKDDGRLTVEEILGIKLKKESLVFLASCDTNNVLNGEGLVSLSWAMMGSGATTVISAGWEANDKSTETFTKAFYQNYRRGSSTSEALQKASLELIKNKSNNVHEPYYWAEFTLNGDFR
jgi:CHAT domain-containing protein